MVSVAAVLTCFNRKQKTVACLENLFNQALAPDVEVHAYLVDDGSTDGTSEAVKAQFPRVQVLQGNGNLFWNRGMHKAFEAAIKDEHDYYLWLNDDTVLYPNALDTLLNTAKTLIEQCRSQNLIVVGSTQDPDTGEGTYGGVVQSRWWHPLNHRFIEPDAQPKRCETMNGNCVLISKAVVTLVGNLDPAFSHYAGDYDYGLRATRLGCSVWIAPGYLGACSLSAPDRQKVDANLAQGNYWERMSQPKGIRTRDVDLHPLNEWKVYSQRHGGVLWPFYWLFPYRRLLWASILSTLGGMRKSQA